MKRLTKSQYELISAQFNIAIEFTESFAKKEAADVARGYATAIALDLADAFADSDNRFDKAQFLADCGIKD